MLGKGNSGNEEWHVVKCQKYIKIYKMIKKLSISDRSIKFAVEWK